MHDPFTLADLIEDRARTRGAKAALRFEGEATSYAELERRARQVARGLRAAGVGKGDRVAFLGKNTHRYFELLFGAARIGAVMVPINWRLAPPEMEWIMRDAGARALFYGPEFASMAASGAGLDLRLALPLERPPGPSSGGRDYLSWLGGLEPDHAPAVPGPHDVAVQMYTSGTTGRPKGAMLTHWNLLVFRALPSDAQPPWNRWTEDDVSLVAMPIFHIGGTGFGLQTLCAGGTAIVTREFDAGQVLELIEHHGLSKFFVVTTALQMLLRNPRVRDIDYRRIRTILYGASPIPEELLREAMAVFGCGFVQQYGMTEATGTICALTPEDHAAADAQRMRSAGRPLEGVDIAVVDGQGRRLPPGEIGEIAIRSPTIMRGYWNQPEATAEVLDAEGWFRSGDAGYLDPEGYVYICDRMKDMIISGGENVYPAEVEAALYGHADVAEVAVIGVPSAKWGEEVKAVVVLRPGATPDVPSLLEWTRRRIASYKVPKSIDFVASLPRNASGKLLRREIREPFWAGRERRVN